MDTYEADSLDRVDVTVVKMERSVGITKPLPKSPSQEIEARPSLKDRMRSTLSGVDRSPKARSPQSESDAVLPPTPRLDLNKPIPCPPSSSGSPNTPPKTWSDRRYAGSFAAEYREDSSIVPRPLFSNKKRTPTFTNIFDPETHPAHARSHSDPNLDKSSNSRRNSFVADETATVDDDVPPVPPMPTTFYRVPPRPPHSTLQSTIPYRKPPPPPIPSPPSRSNFPPAFRKPLPLRSSSDFPLGSTMHPLTIFPLPYRDDQPSHSARSSTSSQYSDHPQEVARTQPSSRSTSPSKRETRGEQRHRKKSSLHIITQVEDANDLELGKQSPSTYSGSPTMVQEDESQVKLSGRLSTAHWSADLPHAAPRDDHGDGEEANSVREGPESPQEKSNKAERDNEAEQDIYGIEIPKNQDRKSQGSPDKTALDGLLGVWQPPSREPPLDSDGEPMAMTREEDFQSRAELIKERMKWYFENIAEKGTTLYPKPKEEEEEKLSARDIGLKLLQTVRREIGGKR